MSRSWTSVAAPLAALALVGATAGCNRLRPADTGPGPESCGANLLENMLDAVPTPEVRAYIAGRVGDRPVRYYSQGDAITMDYNPARLNAELGFGGRIKRFRCG